VAAVGTAPASPPWETATSIKYLVIIFQENHSFDAYFATYPVAVNPPGQPAFRARPGTPSVNGLTATLPSESKLIESVPD
jgi:phospholipase C